MDTVGLSHLEQTIYFASLRQGHLYCAWHDGSQWRSETVDDAPGVGLYTSLALDAGGRPHISCYDSMNGNLKYARWAGSVWAIEVVDSTDDVGTYTSLAVDSAGNPHISYSDATHGSLKHARWMGSSCDIATVAAAEGPSSLALDSAGNPHLQPVIIQESPTLTPTRPPAAFRAYLPFGLLDAAT